MSQLLHYAALERPPVLQHLLAQLPGDPVTCSMDQICYSLWLLARLQKLDPRLDLGRGPSWIHDIGERALAALPTQNSAALLDLLGVLVAQRGMLSVPLMRQAAGHVLRLQAEMSVAQRVEVLRRLLMLRAAPRADCVALLEQLLAVAVAVGGPDGTAGLDPDPGPGPGSGWEARRLYVYRAGLSGTVLVQLLWCTRRLQYQVCGAGVGQRWGRHALRHGGLRAHGWAAEAPGRRGPCVHVCACASRFVLCVCVGGGLGLKAVIFSYIFIHTFIYYYRR